jgi:hypothetical protein
LAKIENRFRPFAELKIACTCGHSIRIRSESGHEPESKIGDLNILEAVEGNRQMNEILFSQNSIFSFRSNELTDFHISVFKYIPRGFHQLRGSTRVFPSNRDFSNPGIGAARNVAIHENKQIFGNEIVSRMRLHRETPK